jgi:hypothetical protein
MSGVARSAGGNTRVRSPHGLSKLLSGALLHHSGTIAELSNPFPRAEFLAFPAGRSRSKTDRIAIVAGEISPESAAPRVESSRKRASELVLPEEIER